VEAAVDELPLQRVEVAVDVAVDVADPEGAQQVDAGLQGGAAHRAEGAPLDQPRVGAEGAVVAQQLRALERKEKASWWESQPARWGRMDFESSPRR
jgi:hypothetical protein